MKTLNLTKLSRIFFAIMFSVSYLASSSTFSLRNNQSGASYECRPSDGTSGSEGDPQCVKALRKLCDLETIYSDEECFQEVTAACSSGVAYECVPEVFKECDLETILSDEECFDQSLKACGGAAKAIQKLIREARDYERREVLQRGESERKKR